MVCGWLALLNKVWGLEGCPPFLALRTNRSVRFVFGGLTVLSGRSGHSVSFYTTVGGGVALLKAVWGQEGVGF
jgi:hypothetical protein